MNINRSSQQILNNPLEAAKANSDILFDSATVAKLLRSDKDITLLVGSYRPDQHQRGRKVDTGDIRDFLNALTRFLRKTGS